MNIRQKGGKWWIDIQEPSTVPGVRGKRVRAGFDSRDDALAALDKIRSGRRTARRMRALGIPVPADTIRGVVTFEEFARKVIARHSSLKRAKTRACHESILTGLLRSPHFAGQRLCDITAEQIAEWFAERYAEKPAIANRSLAFIKLVFGKAVAWGELSSNPARSVAKVAERPGVIRILTDAQAKALVEKSSSRLRPVIRLLLGTGMRKSEALAARWAFPEWEHDPALVTTIIDLRRKVAHIPGMLAKSHRSREIPLSSGLVEMFTAMRRGHKDGDRVFPMGDIRKAFHAAAKAAKITGLRTHHLRHTALSKMATVMPIMDVCEIAGHADLKITMRYLHPSDAAKREGIERADAAFAVKPVKMRPKCVTVPKTVPVSDCRNYN